MMKRLLNLAFVVAIAASALTLAGGAAEATNKGNEGCTPGYWKNHTDNWWENADNTVPSYGTNENFGDVFGVDYDVTLLVALRGGGGGGIAGAHKILARAATAAILNAAHEGLGYPLSRFGPSGIFAQVDDVWDSGNRSAILRLATRLDRLNNLGCPLN